jgi:hypothetical protein
MRWVLVVAIAACGSAPLHTVRLDNQTDRVIEEVYIYPTGSPNHGTSRGQLAPHATAEVQVRQGNVDVLAISAKVQIDEHPRERRTATQTLDLRKPLHLIFHDSDKPVSTAAPDTLGVVFQVDAPTPPPK